MRRSLLAAALLSLAPTVLVGAQGDGASRGVAIPAGAFVPRFAADDTPVTVAAFRLDAHPVTVAEYVAFLEAAPAWRRSRVPALFADAGYLASWRGDLDAGPAGEDPGRPVTEVSWFAARTFCGARGGRLPTTREWEYAAAFTETGPPAFRDHDFNARLRGLYARRPAPDALPPVGTTFRSSTGVWDLHGLVWEWTSDFNNQMATGAGRDDQGLDRGLFCAAGSEDATDRSDYAAFLRFAYRASLDGDYAGRRLGFRCAYDLEGAP